MEYVGKVHVFDDVPSDVWEHLDEIFGSWVTENGFSYADFITPNSAEVGLSGLVVIKTDEAAKAFRAAFGGAA